MPADDTFTATETSNPRLALRTPTVHDAAQIWQLVRASTSLDNNSCYAYLLLCDHFADTCVVAVQDKVVCGFLAAYRSPARPNVIFVWQIGVAAEARRQRVASRLLDRLLSLPACSDVRFLEATVTPSNNASRRLFQSFARHRRAPCHIHDCFTAEMFGLAGHEQEQLFRIGPLVDAFQEVAHAEHQHSEH